MKKISIALFAGLMALSAHAAVLAQTHYQSDADLGGISSAPPADKCDNGATASDCYYTNSDGDEIHRPQWADSAPIGATTRCRDGRYSSSRHRSGTCSGHGGVAQWL